MARSTISTFACDIVHPPWFAARSLRVARPVSRLGCLTAMRTCVRMGPRPWRPAAELEAALERGDLRYAVTLAEEVRAEHGPLPLGLAARFLPLVARESPREYDAWALRWLTDGRQSARKQPSSRLRR